MFFLFIFFMGFIRLNNKAKIKFITGLKITCLMANNPVQQLSSQIATPNSFTNVEMYWLWSYMYFIYSFQSLLTKHIAVKEKKERETNAR